MEVYLGTRLLAQDVRPLNWEARMSIAFFCPQCGDVWGRVVKGPTWYPCTKPCAKHPTPWHIGGSFFQDFDWAPFGPEALLLLHPKLAAHECSVSLAWAERFSATDPAAFRAQLELQV